MNKRYHNGGWFFNQQVGDWCYVAPGWYEESMQLPDEAILHRIDGNLVALLVAKLDEEGKINPRLDERLRVEDLKITHRLIDLLEKGVSHG